MELNATLGFFETFSSESSISYDKLLFSLSSIEDESPQDAYQHHEFLVFVMSVFQKNKSNVLALVGDNTNTNRSAFSCLDVLFWVGTVTDFGSPSKILLLTMTTS